MVKLKTTLHRHPHGALLCTKLNADPVNCDSRASVRPCVLCLSSRRPMHSSWLFTAADTALGPYSSSRDRMAICDKLAAQRLACAAARCSTRSHSHRLTPPAVAPVSATPATCPRQQVISRKLALCVFRGHTSSSNPGCPEILTRGLISMRSRGFSTIALSMFSAVAKYSLKRTARLPDVSFSTSTLATFQQAA